MAGIGRSSAASVPSGAERSFPECRIRRRAARFPSDRCRIVPRCSDGLSDKASASETGAHGHTAGKWRRRFPEDRPKGLSGGTRSERPRTVGGDRTAYVVERTPNTTSADATRRSPRLMAGASGLPHTAIRRIRAIFGLRPRRSGPFRPCGDPAFADKVRDAAGLHPSPPDRALVLRVDERRRIRTPGRTRPALPMMPAIPERSARARRRNGTAPLFAASGVATGKSPRCDRARGFPTSRGESTPVSPGSRTSASSRTTTPPTKLSPPGRGRRGDRTGMSTSCRSRPPGPIRSGAGLPNRRTGNRNRAPMSPAGQSEVDVRILIEGHDRGPKPFKRTKSADDTPATVKRRYRINRTMPQTSMPSDWDGGTV